jgi:hypothetical protein
MVRMQPSPRQLGNQRLDATRSHFPDVGESTGPTRGIVRHCGGVDQHEALDTIELPPDHLERHVSAEGETDQREAARTAREQRLGHRTERVLVAKHEHHAIVVGLEPLDLPRVQSLITQMGAREDEGGALRHRTWRLHLPCMGCATP